MADQSERELMKAELLRFAEALIPWMFLRNKRIRLDQDRTKIHFGKNIYPVRRVALKVCHIHGGGDLFLYAAFETMQDGYKSVLGYFVKEGNVKCRHFYRSNSESAWRAGTGIRAGTENERGWVKSAEGHKSNKGSGYIMEAMLPRELELALDAFHAEKLPPLPWLGEQPHVRSSLIVSADWQYYIINLDPTAFKGFNYQEIKEYLINPELDRVGRRCSGIIEEYVQERTYVYSLEYESDVRTVHTPARTEGIYNVNLQSNFSHRNKAVTKARDNVSYSIKDMLASQNPRNPNLQILANLLDNPVNGEYFNPTHIHHSALGMAYNYHTYVFSPRNSLNLILHIEIAYTDNSKSLTYKGLDGEEKTATTPICWVRNAYIRSMAEDTQISLTSFGSFKSIPIDLAFLVQKPCDYVTQTSTELNEAVRVRVITRANNPGYVADFDRKKNTPENPHILGDYLYTGLAVFNESTSYLIKLFKESKGFPRFTGKYKAFAPEKDPVTLHRLVKLGVEEYLTFQGEENKTTKLTLFQHKGIKDSHGSEGLTRANNFLNHITGQRYDLNDTVSDVYALFARGQINGISATGWIGNKIQANPYSLFTYVAKVIICHYYGVFGPQGQTPGKYSAVLTLNTVSRSKGKDSCVQRMLGIFVKANNPPGAIVDLEEWVRRNAPALLEAFKR